MAYLFGRDGVIRTHDPLHPMQVRYQAALRPEPVTQQCNERHYSAKACSYSRRKLKKLFGLGSHISAQ